MDVFGFREAMAASQPALMPGGVQVPVASLPALALLKIVCWRDRHYKAPRKDAQDLQMILQHYLAAGNEPRLWDEFVDWTPQDDFDYESAGPRMLGQAGPLTPGLSRPVEPRPGAAVAESLAAVLARGWRAGHRIRPSADASAT